MFMPDLAWEAVMENSFPSEMPNRITLIVDYRNAFYSSTRNAKTHCSMNIPVLKESFKGHGIQLEVISFSQVDFSRDWFGQIVLYQSSEDPGLHYRSYIEDVMLGLSTLGACLLPAFPYLRAHHNKCYFEILRKTSGLKELNNLGSQVFGTYEDFRQSMVSYPSVLKVSDGAGSRGVQLLSSHQEAETLVRRASFSGYSAAHAKEFFYRATIRDRVPYSTHRSKFVVQEFIPGLDHDFKVLIYGPRAFVLRRGVRDNDFRASGSGKFQWPDEVPEGLLDFGWKVLRAFDVSHISMDIAVKDARFYIIEAQFLQFGPLTMEKAPHHWELKGGVWEKSHDSLSLESVFTDGVIWHLQHQMKGAHTIPK